MSIYCSMFNILIACWPLWNCSLFKGFRIITIVTVDIFNKQMRFTNVITYGNNADIACLHL